MATLTTPKFLGKLLVVAGTNDKIVWYEDDDAGGHSANLTTTVAAGWYWPDALATALGVAMRNESNTNGMGAWHGGAGVFYSVSINAISGFVSINASAMFGACAWFPRITNVETDKLLTGGDLDTDSGAALADGARAYSHFGWNQDAAYPGEGTTFTSDAPIAHSWFPTEPPAKDSGYELEAEVPVLSTPNGYLYHADYSGISKGIEKRTVRFEYQADASRLQAAYSWWKWYAKAGGEIRYYPDATTGTYTPYKLAQESCRRFPLDTRLQGYGYFSGEFVMQKVWI